MNIKLSEPETEQLLYTLCVDLGFCLPPDKHQEIVNDPPPDVEAFARAVFLAEGLDPDEARPQLWKQVTQCVMRAFKNRLYQ